MYNDIIVVILVMYIDSTVVILVTYPSSLYALMSLDAKKQILVVNEHLHGDHVGFTQVVNEAGDVTLLAGVNTVRVLNLKPGQK